MSAHHLHLDEFSRWAPEWRLSCDHAPDDPAWICRTVDGEPDGDGCWLESWWSNDGIDLVQIEGPITTFPIPVRPSDDWGYENGGTIVREEGK